MRVLKSELENRKVSVEKLLEHGFVNKDRRYLYECSLSTPGFKMLVEYNGELMTSRVIDVETGEDYHLADVPDSTGEFVGRIKSEYECLIKDIIVGCTYFDVFKSEQAKEVIDYVREKYKDELEYLWKKTPKNAIWRNKKNNKWYGALLVIEESKLGSKSNRLIEIIDLRYQKDNIKRIIDERIVYPGYHMNKDSWITIKLDGSMESEELFKLIDNSYKISLEK